MELITEDPIKTFSFEGGTIINKTKYSLDIELDLSITSIDKLLTHALKNFDLKDINISDPPLEEIIADIYRGKTI